MRFVMILLWVAVAAALLWPLLRRVRMAAPRVRDAFSDELVKDPVCQTYIVKSKAVRRVGTAGPLYFCSTQCAGRYGRE